MLNYRYGLEIIHMKLVEELDYQIDFDQLKNRCPDNLTLDSMGHRMQGLSIQHRKNVVAPWNTIDGLESLRNNYDKDCTEKDFNIVHKNFKNTEFERIVNDFNLVRSRIMLLHGKRCYSIHPDDSWRLHIPITTNPGCLFYFPDHKEHFHLEEGKVYKVNTTERHTFLNTSTEDRIHFIGCIYN